MTFEERTIVKTAINQAKRGWVRQAGGFNVVEKDAKNQDLLLDRRCKKGWPTYAELEAENTELRRRLKASYQQTSETRRSRDHWYYRATGNQPGDGRGGSRRKKKAAVDSQSTSVVG